MKKFIIDAESKLLIFWDIVILVASLYIAIEIPLVIVFKIQEDLFFRILIWFITSIYIFDIVLSFNTSVYVKGKEITDRLYIAKRYLQSWFIIDLLAAFPFSSLLRSMKHMEALSKLLKLFRLGRLLKLIRITGTIQNLQVPG